ncbi:MAG: TatD family hydrolase [Bacteriovoracaceae bacterium]
MSELTPGFKYIDVHTHALTHDPNIREIEVLDARMPPGFGIGHGLFCYGLHPWHIDEVDEKNYFETLKGHLQSQKFFALGEIGVDRSRPKNLENQLRLFNKQLAFAERFKIRRLVIHAVRAYSDIIGPLKELSHKPAVILHDYNGNMETANQFLDSINCYFSFGSRLFNLDAKGTKAFQAISLDKIFLETDDQYDKTIMDIYQQAADIKKEPLNSLASQIQSNFQSLLAS